ncbi:DNRLRE domain-containing protein [Nonomuraea sp. NPDC049129]|uniref:DNRLRE domain-containing protein n=1 Tax=unclassified Nonomuraea TaxID=2593643 RepID=UPI0033ECE289
MEAATKQLPGEILGAATESRRVVRRQDGQVIIETWSRPVRLKQNNGAWAWIDTGLVEKDGAFRPKLVKASLAFTAGGQSEPFAQLSTAGGQSLALSWPTPLPRPQISANRATYDLGDGAQLVVSAMAAGFRYEIVLQRRPTIPLDLTLPVQVKGASSGERREELVDAQGRTVLRALTPRLHIKPGRRTATKSAPSAFKSEQSGDNLRVALDGAKLDTAAFPVTISGSVAMPTSADVDVSDEGGTGDPSSPLLMTGGIFGIRNRGLLRFDTMALTGQRIIDAKLSVVNTDGPGCGESGDGIQVRRTTSRWDPYNLTWANKPATTTEGATIVTQSHASDCGRGTLDWPVKEIAAAWASGSPNYGLTLQEPNEANTSDNFRELASTEYGDPGTEVPKLTVVTQPVPAPQVLYPAGPDGVEVFTAPADWKLDGLPVSSENVHALNGADNRAQANATTLAPPYFDPASGRVVAPATPAGKDTASKVLSGIAVDNGDADETLAIGFENEDSPAARTAAVAAAETPYSITPRYAEVANSYQALNTITDQVLDLDETIPAGTALFATQIWPQRNLAVVQSTDASAGLRKALADRYGTYNVAIWLRSESDRPRLDVGTTSSASTSAADTRQKDTGKLNGGSAFSSSNPDGTEGGCTTGFAMGTAADHLMVSAGHCVVSDGITSAGVVEWTNWVAGQGTIKLPNQPTYYGDVSLIQTVLGRVTSPTIFIGGRDSAEKQWVGGRFSVPARETDQYCVGGASPDTKTLSNGQICGFKVTDIGWKVEGSKPKSTTRWLQVGKKSGRCTIRGDSGAPVYTFRKGDGYVVAKGIHHGSNNVDNKPSVSTCVNYFTDIHDVMKAVGKDVYKK